MPFLRRIVAALTSVLVLQLALGGSMRCASDLATEHGAPAAVASGMSHEGGHAGMSDGHQADAPEPADCSRAPDAAPCDNGSDDMPCMTANTCASVAVPSAAAVARLAAAIPAGELPPPRALRSIPGPSPDLPPPRA